MLGCILLIVKGIHLLVLIGRIICAGLLPNVFADKEKLKLKLQSLTGLIGFLRVDIGWTFLHRIINPRLGFKKQSLHCFLWICSKAFFSSRRMWMDLF